MKKKILSTVLALCILISCVSVAFNVSAASVDTQVSQADTNESNSSANTYGLLDNPQEGVILHAWNWSYNNIKANMKTIAESGYTSVQVSPIQVAKEDTMGKNVGNWWVFYQPAGFTIDNTGTNALGVKSEFKAMCDEAHKYGVKVIVDVVANHLGNKSDWRTVCDRAYQYEPQIAGSWLFHDEANCHDGSAWNVVKGQIGMPDLQTENSHVQQRVLSYLKECIDNGADGFRFDAAKHIETPDDGSVGSQFWPTVINGASSYYDSKGTYDSLYCYGEILNTCGNGRSYNSYTKYMSITDNTTGNNIRGAVAGGNASGAASSHYNTGQSPDKVVLWAESHDTYANDSKESTYVSDQNINKTWALVGSRNKATALYFARPKGYSQGTLGNIESSQWKSNEVAQINKFHNYFNGQSEYLSSNGSIAYNERGTEGVILVNCSGTSASVNVTANKMANGTYKDQITGNTFTVSGGKISGQIGNTGIAVVYNAVKKPVASVTPGSQSYKTDTLKLTLNYANATSGQYSIDGGAFQNFTNGQTITIGSGLAYDTVTTVSVKASDGTTTSDVATYTYTKVDPTKSTKIYFDNSAYNWSSVNAYIYSESLGTSIAEWPGVKMNYDSALKLYYYEIPEAYEKDGLVLFAESASSSNRYPADGEPGLEIGGSSKIFKANHAWENYVPEIKPTDPTKPTEPETDPTEPSKPTEPTKPTVPKMETLNVDVTSNLCNEIEQTYSANEKTVTVTVDLQSDKLIADGEVYINYDPTKLKISDSNYDKNGNIAITPTISAVGGEFVNTNYDKDTVAVVFTNLKKYDFTTSKPLVKITFDVIGTGDTTVDVDVRELDYITDDNEDLVILVRNSIPESIFDAMCELKTSLSTPTIFIPDGEILIGDVVTDGEINIKDVTKVLSHVAKLTTLKDAQLFAADSNGDGVVNVKDATNIQMYVANNGKTTTNVGKYYIDSQDPTVPSQPTDPTKPTEPVTDPTKPTDPTVPDSDTYKVYFKNTSNWSTPYIHYWNDSDTTTWPGNPMTLVSGDVYVYEVPKDMTGVIFNNNNGAQTDDLTMPTQDGMMFNYSTGGWSKYNGGNDDPTIPSSTTTVYFRNTSNWSTPYIHYWNDGNTTTWPGNQMTLVSGNVYKYEVPSGMTGVIFNDNNGTQTGNLTMPTQQNMIFDFGSGSWSQYNG